MDARVDAGHEVVAGRGGLLVDGPAHPAAVVDRDRTYSSGAAQRVVVLPFEPGPPHQIAAPDARGAALSTLPASSSSLTGDR